MNGTIAGKLKRIASLSLAGVLALALLGSAEASANTLSVQQLAEAEMNNGKDYSAAWQAAMRAYVSVPSKELIAQAQKAETQMNEGKDYHAAWATRPASDSRQTVEQLAKTKGLAAQRQFK